MMLNSKIVLPCFDDQRTGEMLAASFAKIMCCTLGVVYTSVTLDFGVLPMRKMNCEMVFVVLGLCKDLRSHRCKSVFLPCM